MGWLGVGVVSGVPTDLALVCRSRTLTCKTKETKVYCKNSLEGALPARLQLETEALNQSGCFIVTTAEWSQTISSSESLEKDVELSC